MHVAVVYNKDRGGTINVFGIQNREWYPQETIDLVVESLEKSGHSVELIPADRMLLTKLKKFLPKLSKRRHNGIVLNIALGVQGKCRYTHIPSILEVAGIPYTGSSPEGHTLALDKVVTKQLLMASHLPTPDYRVYYSPDIEAPHLKFPIIVKPRGEAGSYGLKVVNDKTKLIEAVSEIITEFKQPALAEEFIEGREVNVSLLGNHPPLALPVLELVMSEGPKGIYSHEHKFDKRRRKKTKKICPAKLPRETSAYLQKLALQAFEVLDTYDYGRLDFRLDQYNQPYILEMNSMASINPDSSFVTSAKKAGLDYSRLINRIIEVAVERYAREAPDYFGSQNNYNNNKS